MVVWIRETVISVKKVEVLEICLGVRMDAVW